MYSCEHQERVERVRSFKSSDHFRFSLRPAVSIHEGPMKFLSVRQAFVGHWLFFDYFVLSLDVIVTSFVVNIP